MFVDEAENSCESRGTAGTAAVAFRRENIRAARRPVRRRRQRGIGGSILPGSESGTTNTLLRYRYNREFKAGSRGAIGEGSNSHGTSQART